MILGFLSQAQRAVLDCNIALAMSVNTAGGRKDCGLSKGFLIYGWWPLLTSTRLFLATQSSSWLNSYLGFSTLIEESENFE